MSKVAIIGTVLGQRGKDITAYAGSEIDDFNKFECECTYIHILDLAYIKEHLLLRGIRVFVDPGFIEANNKVILTNQDKDFELSSQATELTLDMC